MTDIVDSGTQESDEGEQPISYAIGPPQMQRILGVLKVPPALGVAALAIAVPSMMTMNPAGEIGDIRSITSHASSNLTQFRWAAGLRTGLSALALVLAITGIVILLGRRPTVTFEPADFENDDETLDAMEAAALANVPKPPVWVTTILGAALVVSLIALALNASSFGYAMASHFHPTQDSPFGF